jgi:glucose dehydrogenase
MGYRRRALGGIERHANPATYMYKGRQYVVFVVGGNAILKPQASDQVVAYALPQGNG